MAVTIIRGICPTFEVEDSEDVKIGELVELDATLGTVKTATSGTTLTIGVAIQGFVTRTTTTGALPTEDTLSSGEMVTVQNTGIVKLVNSGESSISAGDFLQVTSDGKVLSCTTTKNGASIGKALEATSTADAQIKVALGVN